MNLTKKPMIALTLAAAAFTATTADTAAASKPIADFLNPLGYAVSDFGKSGIGGRDSTGVPEKHGFDVCFSYYNQAHAHTCQAYRR